MLQMFYLVLPADTEKTFQVRHIQYNIHKRLQQLKYVSYRRINIRYDNSYTVHTVSPGLGMICGITGPMPAIGDDITSKASIASIYKAVIDSLKLLWEQHQWEVYDLESILRGIEVEDYKSWVLGKAMASPDRSVKAAVYCELYPAYTDYYLRFLGRGNKWEKSIHFLQGFQDPESVFLFFHARKWQSNNHFVISWEPEISINFYTDKDEAEFSYNPVNNTLEALHNYVKAQQAGISLKERARSQGMPH